MCTLRLFTLVIYFIAKFSLQISVISFEINSKTNKKNSLSGKINVIPPGPLSNVTNSVTYTSTHHVERRLLAGDKGVTISLSRYEVQENVSSQLHLFARGDVFQQSKELSPLNISMETGDVENVTGLIPLNRRPGQFFISHDDCNNKVFRLVSQTEGFIYGKIDRINLLNRSCAWNVIVPEGMFMLISMEIKDPCDTIEFKIVVSDHEHMNESTIIANITCEHILKRVLASMSNILYFRLVELHLKLSLKINFQIHILVTSQSYRLTLPAVFEQPHSGYVTSPGYSEYSIYSGYTNASYRLNVPSNNSVMISFHRIDIEDGEKCNNNYVSLSVIESSGLILKFKGCETNIIPTSIYNTSLLIQFVTSSLAVRTGFKMFFSFHPQRHLIHRSPEGLFDCSVPYYLTFKHHLTCNLEQECIGGEDEKDCPFSNAVCNGSVDFENKCYSYHHSEHFITWVEAQQRCQERGGNLAMPKTEEERKAIEKIFHYGKRIGPAYFGLHNVYSIEHMMYRYIMKWVDGSVAYCINSTFIIKLRLKSEICAMCFRLSPFIVFITSCRDKLLKDFICEIEKPTGERKEALLSFPISNFPIVNRNISTIVQCPSGHFTHNFLTCSPESVCGETRYLNWCQVSNRNWLNENAKDIVHEEEMLSRTVMFVCVDRKRTIHYTLVCDFHYNCIDRSDEEFCIHDICPQHTCQNRQCLDFDKICNNIEECSDRSDEMACATSFQIVYTFSDWIYPPATLNFDNKGDFYKLPMQYSQPCPVTHFRCHGEKSYCLPVYVRCNGVYDCPDHEDEMGCEMYTCPGFYRCFNSKICVHVDNVCDGFAHCPLRDDELCDLKCPDGCQCQGLAFVCKQTFSPGSYPELRYLDASGSQLSMNDVTRNLYLVWLSLRACQLKFVTQLNISNLMTLDLRDNLISYIEMNVFINLKQLSELILAGNPLVSLTSHPIKATPHFYLKSVDVAHTLIRVFHSDAFQNYPMISFINVSYSPLNVIDDDGFLHLQRIKTFDARGTPLSVFPKTLFHGLIHLETVYSDNYRLCCDDSFSKSFSKVFCLSQLDVYSSCEHLLRSVVHSFLLWVMVVLAIVGNTSCFLFIGKYIITKASCTRLFMLNLNFADLLMGVYLALIGGSDLVFRGQYVKYEDSWKASVTCKVAGYLSILSTQVSIFLVFIITLDRYIVLRFPCGRFHFRAWSVAVFCGLAWLSSILLSAVPFSPLASPTDIRGLSSICNFKKIIAIDFGGEKQALDLMVVFNLLLISIIAVLQSFVSLSSNTIYLTTDKSQLSLDKNVARRFSGIVLFKVLFYFLTGVAHLSAIMGSAIPGEIQAILDLIIPPLNSVLDPLLYAFSLLREKQRRAFEIHLNNWFKSHNVTKMSILKSTRQANEHLMTDFSLNEEDAFRILGENLRKRSITLPELKSYFEDSSQLNLT